MPDEFNELSYPGKKLQVIRGLTELHKAVSLMLLVWEDQEINAKVDIQELIPASLDEWALQIGAKIDECKKAMTPDLEPHEQEAYMSCGGHCTNCHYAGDCNLQEKLAAIQDAAKGDPPCPGST